MWVNQYKELVDTPKLREVCMGSDAVFCFHGTEKEYVLLKQERFKLDLKKDFQTIESGWIEYLIHILDRTSYFSLSLFSPL